LYKNYFDDLINYNEKISMEYLNNTKYCHRSNIQ
jgi:hypothetical protein